MSLMFENTCKYCSEPFIFQGSNIMKLNASQFRELCRLLKIRNKPEPWIHKKYTRNTLRSS